MKIIVCGGRNFKSPAQVWAALDRLHAATPVTALMQGGATGVDTFAREWAVRHPGIQRLVCHADWDKHGRAAGPIRNARMLDWKPDAVVAFPGGPGTNNMIKLATEAGVKVIHLPDDPNEAYDIVPIPPGELMHAAGWYTLRCNGVPWMHGTLEQMQKLAADPELRAEERLSKKLHDVPPTPVGTNGKVGA